MHGDEIARSEDPQDRCDRHYRHLRPKGRQKSRRSSPQLQHWTFRNLIELLDFRECSGETDTIDLDVALVVVGFFGQNATGAVQAISKERQDEALESTGTTDLEASKISVGQHAELLALAASLPNVSSILEQPSPRPDDGPYS